MPKRRRAFGLWLLVAGAWSCSGRVALPEGAATGGTTASPSAGVAGKLGGDVAGASGASAGSGSVNGGSQSAGSGGVSGASGGNDAAAGEAAGGAGEIEAEVALMPTADHAVTGTVHFSASAGRVDMTVTLANCPAGAHALHLHANPACGDNGNAAGGHWSPQGELISDLVCAADGTAQHSQSTESALWSIGGPAASDLLRHALILHSGPTVPEPGARIACGIPRKVR